MGIVGSLEMFDVWTPHARAGEPEKFSIFRLPSSRGADFFSETHGGSNHRLDSSPSAGLSVALRGLFAAPAVALLP